MAPSNPKRPPRPPRPPAAAAPKKEEVELPFDDDEVAPLQEDDPRPQRVPQFPAGPRRMARGHRGTREVTKDRELATRFDTNEYSDPGHVPAYLYVEKGPGAGQLIPVKQGPLVIGRASACDLRLQHPSISRRHAQLVRQADRFVLRDLGSQNGTFVNRVKLSGDKEIHLGDEISLGNAILKLRGHGSITSDQVPQVSLPVRPSKRKGMSLPRVALVATAVGSAAAALLTVALVKFSDPGQPASDAQQAESAPVAPTDAPAQEAESDSIPPPPASEEESLAAAPEPAEEPPPTLAVVLPREEAPEPAEPKAENPRGSAAVAKSSSSRKESGSRSIARAPKRQEASSEPSSATKKAPVAPPATVARADILSLYEKGEVEVALSLARKSPYAPLAKQIAEYQSAATEGQKALSARDTAGAIRHLTTALAVDQELSQGWSVQGRKLRQQLGRLYTQAGQAQVKAGSRDAARASFETALKYDPSNTWAKAELQALDGKP